VDGKASRVIFLFLLAGVVADGAHAPKYELLLRGGHVIDPRNGVSG